MNYQRDALRCLGNTQAQGIDRPPTNQMENRPDGVIRNIRIGKTKHSNENDAIARWIEGCYASAHACH